MNLIESLSLPLMHTFPVFQLYTNKATTALLSHLTGAKYIESFVLGSSNMLLEINAYFWWLFNADLKNVFFV